MVSTRPQEVQSYYWETTVAWLCVYVCAVMFVFMQGWSQSKTLGIAFASTAVLTAANGTLPLALRGVELLSDCLSKPLPPAIKAQGLKSNPTV